MIKYALVCDHDHSFEGWFGAAADYDDQSERGLVGCPACGSHTVRKQIMAPAVAGTKAKEAGAEPPARTRAMMMEAMGQVRAHVEANFDYMGDAFATEARAIHEGRSEERGIYGEATPAEVKALVEDGVKIAPLPPAKPKKRDVN
ncbi:MAG TPA: DUF1178 family protein [Caulobacteraceae bacterium]|jgi:hypothetical protein|nr:DUF1178 family protein [Caulobacteraceae bacterium]